MPDTRHFFVINLHSFRSANNLKQVLLDIDSCFSGKHNADYKTYMSRYPRDAVAAVHRYITSTPKNETARIYAVGGDGILFDCLNGMMGFENAELTSVPYGSTNNYTRAFGEDSKAAFRDIKKLSRAPSRPVDVIHCGTNYALVEVNIGIVGKTVIHANKILRDSPSKWIRWFSPWVYTLCAASAVSDMELVGQHYTVKADGEDMSGSYSNIHVANIPCDGGEFVPSPYAVPDDGMLDVITVRSAGRLKTMRAISDRNKGTFEKHKIFNHSRRRVINVESELPLCIQIDGESLFAKEIKLEIVPNGVKFFAPEDLKFADYSDRAYKAKPGERHENKG
ncbi:MAG: hypothetical protein FWB83_11570 [Treponema sp.]|nr:hypothetical protein [Treponema sp.]MCL2181751.1 hypothetical protein [Treponema sp.]